MATPPALTQIAFAAGLDESQQSEVLDPTAAFPVLQNVRQPVRGAADKRLGYGSLTLNRLSGSRSAGRRLLEHNGVPVVIDGSYLDVYSEDATKNITRSRVPECTYRLMDMGVPSSSAIVHDVEHCNGFVAVAYGYAMSSATSLVATNTLAVVSTVDGSTVLSLNGLTGAGVAMIGSYGDRYFIAFHHNDSTTEILAYYCDTQNLAGGWVLIGQVAATSSNAFPSVCSLSNRVAIAYGTTSGASRVTVKTYTIAGVSETRTITAASTPGKVSCDGSIAGTLWVAFSQSTAIHAIGLDADSLASTLATDVTALTATTGVINLGICEGSSSGTARVWVLSNTSAPPRIYMAGLTTSAGAAVAGSSFTVYNVVPSSRPFHVGGRYYMAFATGVSTTGINANVQANTIVADWSEDEDIYVRPVGNLEPGLVTSIGFLTKCARVSSTKRVYGFQVAKAGAVTFSSVVSGLSAAGSMLAELDFGSRARWLPTKHGSSTFLGGALTSVYDGSSVTELGFLSRPTAPSTSVASGSLTGTFNYVAIYEATDATGNVVVSSISDPAQAEPSSEDVTVSTHGLACTSRRNWRVVFYRTTDGGEAPYYRLGVGTWNAATFKYEYTDSTDDATLEVRPKLYAPNLPGTAGEAQDRRAPPGLPHLVSYNGMLVGAKGSSIFYSGQEVYGEATWFSPVFEVPVSGGGDITGLRVQDGTLFVFKADRVFAVQGEAPSDNGLQGGLGVPRLLASDCGCIEPNSLLATAAGIWFQSARGLEVLTRSQTVANIGDPIQETLASYPVVTAAVLDVRNSLVRFSLAASESAGAVSGNGRDVVYDLRLQTWVSVDDKTGASSHEPSQSACLVYLDSAWRYAWLGTNGTIYYERDEDDASAYLDGSTWVTKAAETASFKQGGIQGQQILNSLLLLARKQTDHNLSASLAYNYETSYRTAREWTRSEINALLTAGWPITQLKHLPHDDNESQAVRVRIADATPTGGTVGNGRGSVWIALTLDITPKPGIFDVPEEAA